VEIKIALLLHFYQPWWQYQSVLERIVNECYRPILNILKNVNGFCFSVNANYALFELLEKAGFDDVICGFKTAAKLGKIELLGSTAYHPIMPLIPDFLQRASLEKDALLKQKYFGIEKNCNGVYLPEMAFSQKAISLLKSMGYNWTIIDDEQFDFEYGYAPHDHIISLDDFKIFFRSRLWSNRISFFEIPTFEKLWERMKYEIPIWTQNKPLYIILAMDAETFGHHSKDKNNIQDILIPMIAKLRRDNIIISFEELMNKFPVKIISHICDGSWSTTKNDLRHNCAFPLWNYNKHHKDLWKLANIAFDCSTLSHYYDQLLDDYDPSQSNLLNDCMKIATSCHWWWLAKEQGNWDPEFAKFGARLAFEIIKKFGNHEKIEKAEKLFKKIESLKKD